MAKRPRVPGTKHQHSAGLYRFQVAIVAKCRERGVPREGVNIPDEIVEEVVNELYGGWTDQARNYVKLIEERDRDDMKAIP
jgi:hypothetical protein